MACTPDRRELLRPPPPPYDPLAWVKLAPARARPLVCEARAPQGCGTPLAIYALHALEVVAYVGGWCCFCSFTPGLARVSELGSWWLSPVAFEKAILWSMLWAGRRCCQSGPKHWRV